MSGGRLGNAGYFLNHLGNSTYSEMNTGQDFGVEDYNNSDLIKAQIGGNSKKYNRKISKILSLHLSYYDMKMTKEMKDIIIMMFIREIGCLKQEIIEIQKITLKKLNMVLKKHTLLH